MSNVTQTWQVLREKGLTSNDKPVAQNVDSPWYIKTLLAFSGWLASIFILIFIGSIFYSLLENTVVCFAVGALMVVAAFFILNTQKTDFIEHLGLSVSLAGQMLIIYTFYEGMSLSFTVASVLSALLHITLAVVIPNFVHRVFSAFFASFCLSLAFGREGLPYLLDSLLMFACAWIWLNEFVYPKQHKRLAPIGYGLVLSLMQLKGTVLFTPGALLWSSKHDASVSWAQPWVGEMLCAAVMMYVVFTLLKKNSVPLKSPLALTVLVSALLLSAISMEANGITVGIMVLLLGFFGSNSVLIGVGIASLLFYTSAYYYLLDSTLLAKSATLFVIGALLLIAREAFVKRLVVSGEKANA